MAMNINIAVFWKMTPYSVVERYLTDVSEEPAASIFKTEE
jgi:hypothetical protein